MEEPISPIVDFAAIDFWYHNRSHSEIQLMTRLSKKRKVLFINSIGMRAPLPGRSTNSGFRIFRKIKSLFKGLRKPIKDLSNFYVFSPVIIPAYSTPWLRKINYLIVKIQVKLVFKLLRIKNPIVFETIPTSNEVAKRINSKLEVVYRVDKMSAFGETDQKYISELEKDQISRASRTYYTSLQLLEDEQDIHNGKGLFLDHGVDLELFKLGENTDETPEELTNVKGKIIGFFGGLDDYVIDFDLLEKIANHFKGETLVLIGEATCDISGLISKSNVIHLGFMPVEQVAEIGKFFDVAILPRKNDEWTKYTNPIKIKEYLALGLNIVTMDIPEVRKYSQDIMIADSHQSFIDGIDNALHMPTDLAFAQEKRKLVLNETWDQRVFEVENDLEGLI